MLIKALLIAAVFLGPLTCAVHAEDEFLAEIEAEDPDAEIEGFELTSESLPLQTRSDSEGQKTYVVIAGKHEADEHMALFLETKPIERKADGAFEAEVELRQERTTVTFKAIGPDGEPETAKLLITVPRWTAYQVAQSSSASKRPKAGTLELLQLRFAGILAANVSGSSLSNVVGWNPGYYLTDRLALRGLLGVTLFKTRTADVFPVTEYGVVAAWHLTSLFSVEGGATLQTWFGRGSYFQAIGSAVLGLEKPVLRIVRGFYASYSLVPASVATHEFRVGAELDFSSLLGKR